MLHEADFRVELKCHFTIISILRLDVLQFFSFFFIFFLSWWQYTWTFGWLVAECDTTEWHRHISNDNHHQPVNIPISMSIASLPWLKLKRIWLSSNKYYFCFGPFLCMVYLSSRLPLWKTYVWYIIYFSHISCFFLYVIDCIIRWCYIGKHLVTWLLVVSSSMFSVSGSS